jgi:hypothetical protein
MGEVALGRALWITREFETGAAENDREEEIHTNKES